MLAKTLPTAIRPQEAKSHEVFFTVIPISARMGTDSHEYVLFNPKFYQWLESVVVL